jgi:hypothetical protein
MHCFRGVNWRIFFLHLIITYFLIRTYLSHYKSNYNIWFALEFDILLIYLGDINQLGNLV